MSEAQITINGVAITHSQSMTVRVALASFNTNLSVDGLGSDEHGKFMTESYLKNCKEINRFIFLNELTPTSR